MCPSTEPENTTPGIAVTAAGCAGLQPAFGGSHGCPGANHTFPPSQSGSPSTRRPAPDPDRSCEGPSDRSSYAPSCPYPKPRHKRSARPPPCPTARRHSCSLSHAQLPHDLAALIRIHRINHPRFLPRHQQTPAAPIHQQRRMTRNRSPDRNSHVARHSPLKMSFSVNCRDQTICPGLRYAAPLPRRSSSSPAKNSYRRSSHRARPASHPSSAPTMSPLPKAHTAPAPPHSSRSSFGGPPDTSSTPAHHHECAAQPRCPRIVQHS